MHNCVRRNGMSIVRAADPESSEPIQCPKLSDDIGKHVAWAFDRVYSYPYPTVPPEDGISRYNHGIQHVTRVAMYSVAFANLYRKYGDEDAQKLTAEDMKLIQVAAIYHDSAREGDNEDLWDADSGYLLYINLTRDLGVDKEKAIMLAEAVRNKDYNEKFHIEVVEKPPAKSDMNPNVYYVVKMSDGRCTLYSKEKGELNLPDLNEAILSAGVGKADEIIRESLAKYHVENQTYEKMVFNGDVPTWVSVPAGERPNKNIYQKIIHDSDSLDIIRARPHFESQYTDFYQTTARNNPQAFNELAKIVTEARSIIDLHGDNFYRKRNDIKVKYNECDNKKNPYDKMVKEISTLTRHQKNDYRAIVSLFANGKLLDQEKLKQMQLVDSTAFDETKPLDEKNLNAALREGLVLARGISTPSFNRFKEGKESKIETLVDVELRKAGRRKGVPTESSKEDRNDKFGNFNRSTAQLGWGGAVFTDAGYMIVNPRLEQMSKASSVNLVSGIGKKKNVGDPAEIFTAEEVQSQWSKVIDKQKTGGASTAPTSDDEAVFPSSEIIYRVTDFHAIYFSHEPYLTESHEHSPLLQAVFLQNAYKAKHPNSEPLPLVSYSGTHNSAHVVSPTEEQIKSMWVKMCSDYIKKELNNSESKHDMFNMSIDDIKIYSMYGENEPRSWGNITEVRAAADSNYNVSLRFEIGKEIEAAKNRVIAEYNTGMLSKIQDKDISILSESMLRGLYHLDLGATKSTEEIETIEMSDEPVKSTQDFIREKIVSTLDDLLKIYLDTDDMDQREKIQGDFEKLNNLAKHFEFFDIEEKLQGVTSLISNNSARLGQLQMAFDRMGGGGSGLEGFLVTAAFYNGALDLFKHKITFDEKAGRAIANILEQNLEKICNGCVSNPQADVSDEAKRFLNVLSVSGSGNLSEVQAKQIKNMVMSSSAGFKLNETDYARTYALTEIC
jgi:hypothetical protein